MTRIRCAIGCDPQLATLSVDIDTSIEVEDLKVAIHLKAAPQLNRWGPQELLLVRVVNADIGGLIKHQLIACMSILHFGTFGAFPEDAIEKDELQQFESLQGAFRELSGFHFKAMNSSTVVSEYTQNLTPSLHHIVVLTPSVPPNYTLSMSDNYVNESLESFWKSLPSLEPPNEMLRFTSIPPFFPPDMTALYIRESYFLLFERIKNTLDPVFDSRKIRMAITGNPGTGKSIFLFYILWRLSKMDKNRASSVILHRAKDNGILYIFGPTHCWRSVNETDIIPLLDIPTTWYLTDTLTPCPGEVNAVTILVSSPARKHYSTFLTFGATDSLRCLPVWSLDELQKAAALFPKLNPTDVEARYSVIGGIPRFVLEESDEDLKQIIGNSVSRLNIEKLHLIAEVYLDEDDEICSPIIHYLVNERFQKSGTEFASMYVTELALLHFLKYHQQQLSKFLLPNTSLLMTAGLHNSLCEAYNHSLKNRNLGKLTNELLSKC